MILSIKAGRLSFNSETKELKPDSRLGKLSYDTKTRALSWRAEGGFIDDTYQLTEVTFTVKTLGQPGCFVIKGHRSGSLFFWSQEAEPNAHADFVASLTKCLESKTKSDVPIKPAASAASTAELLRQLTGGVARVVGGAQIKDILNKEGIRKIAANASEESMREIREALPNFPGTESKMSLESVVNSQQFKTTLELFSETIKSGYAPILFHDLPFPETIKDPTTAFLDAIEKRFGKDKEGDKSGDNEEDKPSKLGRNSD